jgi:hypothetical protein
VLDENPWAVNETHLGATNTFTVIIKSVAQPFSILSIVSTKDIVTITWESVAGRTYRAQYKQRIEDPAWSDIIPDVPATGTTTSVSEPLAPGQQRFYRIIIP